MDPPEWAPGSGHSRSMPRPINIRVDQLSEQEEEPEDGFLVSPSRKRTRSERAIPAGFVPGTRLMLFPYQKCHKHQVGSEGMYINSLASTPGTSFLMRDRGKGGIDSPPSRPLHRSEGMHSLASFAPSSQTSPLARQDRPWATEGSLPSPQKEAAPDVPVAQPELDSVEDDAVQLSGLQLADPPQEFKLEW